MATINNIPFKGDGGFVPIGSKKFAIGLHWRTFEEEDIKIDKYARSIAKDYGANLYSINRPLNDQIGFGSTTVGHKSGMPVFAFQIAENIGESFLAIFKIESLFYIIGMTDGKVLPGTDRMIESMDSASEMFEDLRYGHHFDRLIAPSDFNIDQTKNSSIEEFIGGPSKNKMEKANTSVRSRHLIAGAIVFSLLGGAYYMYSAHEAKKQAIIDAENRARNLLMMQRHKEEVMRKARLFHVPTMPYVNKVEGISYIKACQNAILNYPKDTSGWTAKKITCEDNQIISNFNRIGGTINWLDMEINTPNFHPKINLDKDGAKLTSTLNLIGLPVYNKETKTLKNAEEQVYLFKNFEEVFQLINMKQEVGAPSQVKVGPNNKVETIYTYQFIDFEMKTDIDPLSFSNILEKIPALIITSMSLDLDSWTWDIKGKIYEKLPIPPEVELAPDDDKVVATKPGFKPGFPMKPGNRINSINPIMNNRG